MGEFVNPYNPELVAQPQLAVVSNTLVEAVSASLLNIKLSPETTKSLVERAADGQEASYELFSGSFGDFNPDDADWMAADSYFKSHHTNGMMGVIERDGKRSLRGVTSERLRDGDGDIVHPFFITELRKRRAALEVGSRIVDGKTVGVNHVWRPGSSKAAEAGKRGELLPWARVVIIDADSFELTHEPENSEEIPADTEPTEGFSPEASRIQVAHRIVVFPYLRLPYIQRHGKYLAGAQNTPQNQSA